MFEVTLKQLRAAHACYDGYNRVVRMLQGEEFTRADEVRESYIYFQYDKPIRLTEICGNNGLEDALWALRCIEGEERNMRLFAVWCASQVQHLMTDSRSINAIDVAEKFANGLASRKELGAARGAAAEASVASWAASSYEAPYDEAPYDEAPYDEARWAAVWVAHDEACWAATWTAEAAEAAWTAEAAQTEMFLKMCRGQAPWQTEE